MSKLICKHYFLEEIERMRMEEVLLHFQSENIDRLLELDDLEIVHRYNQCVKSNLMLGLSVLKHLASV